MQPTEISQSRENIYSLNWLRGIASLMVCFYHFKLYIWKEETPNKLIAFFSTGNCGVFIFFIISGFVIPYSMYVKKYSLTKFRKFLTKRIVRIEPPYILYILMAYIWDIYAQTEVWGNPVPILNIKHFFLNITYLAPFFKVEWFNIIFWTLAIEFQFYILTGLTFEVMMKKSLYKYIVFATVLAAGFIIPQHLQTVFHYYIYFIIGFQSFQYYIKEIKLKEFLATIIVALFYIYFLKEKNAAVFAAFTVAVIFLLNYDFRIPRFFGNISYSLYLTHGLIGGTLIMFTDHGLPKAFLFSIALFNAIIIAWLYYCVVEKPFLRLSKNIRY